MWQNKISITSSIIRQVSACSWTSACTKKGRDKITLLTHFMVDAKVTKYRSNKVNGQINYQLRRCKSETLNTAVASPLRAILRRFYHTEKAETFWMSRTFSSHNDSWKWLSSITDRQAWWVGLRWNACLWKGNEFQQLGSAYHLYGNFREKCPSNGTGIFLGTENRKRIELYHLQNTGRVFAFSRHEACTSNPYKLYRKFRSFR